MGDIIKDIELSGDIRAFIDNARAQVSTSKNQAPENLTHVGLTAYFLDEITLQIHEARCWSPGFEPKRIIPDVEHVSGIGLCWDVLTRTMATANQLIADRGIPHTFMSKYIDYSNAEGMDGIHLIILLRCHEEMIQEELKELSNDIHTAVKGSIDELLQNPNVLQEDKELIEQIGKTILVIVEGEGEDDDREEKQKAN